ncbi:signal peptidase [Clostridioides difficile]|nr:signal peptidase [Clostridioides difficile]MBZ1323832.1 signal peptidase [Clostridioides difficile]TQY52869.1 signal peptidase [Clostridioides difficile]TQY57999.1 signal peptidase [Clostridioides difficile]HBZ0280235.1 signal peptidase [Clostridioides difficile]
MVCKEGTFKKNVTCRRNFILTKWYVKSTSASLLMLFVLCFILTKWYVKSFIMFNLAFVLVSFILTKWYVKNGAIVDSIDTNIILY